MMCDPKIPFLSRLLTEKLAYIHQKICTRMFKAALVAITPNWKLSKWPIDWIYKYGSFISWNAIYHNNEQAMWMNRTNITLDRRSQRQKEHTLNACIYIKLSSRQNEFMLWSQESKYHRENRWEGSTGQWRGTLGVLVMCFSLIWMLICCSFCENSLSYTFKNRVLFSQCILYFNKSYKKRKE